jgi:BASS family bile acid:Na+ symporter
VIKATADASERYLLVLVLVVAAAGVAAPAPGRALAAGNGIDAALAVLVFATGLSLRLADLAAVRLAWRRIAVVLLVSTAALPALAWSASLLIGDPVLRSGVQAAGVAPAEVATVALCVIAGGDAAVCAALLAASTIITVVAAGPILSLLGASVTVSSAGLLGNLALVIALPLAAGVALRTAWSPGPAVDDGVRLVTVLALLLLLWQVASQIKLDSAYVTVIVALVVYVAGSAALGWLLALRAPAGRATAVLLPVAMRDFAVAAGIATAAFGCPPGRPRCGPKPPRAPPRSRRRRAGSGCPPQPAGRPSKPPARRSRRSPAARGPRPAVPPAAGPPAGSPPGAGGTPRARPRRPGRPCRPAEPDGGAARRPDPPAPRRREAGSRRTARPWRRARPPSRR